MSSVRVFHRALGGASFKTWILGTPRSFLRRRGGVLRMARVFEGNNRNEFYKKAWGVVGNIRGDVLRASGNGDGKRYNMEFITIPLRCD